MDEKDLKREELNWSAISAGCIALVGALVLVSCPAPAHAAPSWLYENDKVVHAAVSAGLAVGAAEYLRRGNGPAVCQDKQKLCAFAAVMAVGVAKELLPAPLNERFDLRDIAANAVGAGLGLYAHGWYITRNRITFTKDF